MRTASTTDMIVLVVVSLVILVGVFFGASAFFELVGQLHTTLTEYIPSIFAWIISFFVSMWLVGMMFAITVWLVGLVIGLIVAISSIFIR